MTAKRREHLRQPGVWKCILPISSAPCQPKFSHGTFARHPQMPPMAAIVLSGRMTVFEYILLQQVFVQEPGTRRTLVAPFRAIHDHEVPGTLSQPHRLTGVKPSSIVRPSILRLGCWQGMVPGMVPLAGNADTTDSSYTTAFSAEDLLTSYDVRWR
jgi:hypothetical protein